MIQQYINIRQAGGGVAVAVSDTTPDLGDTITITATATGFVPTQYQFLLFNGSVTLLAQQVGNALNWTVNVGGGNYDIYVLATDGSINGFNSTLVAVQGDPDATAFLLATGITDVTIQSAINVLVFDLKNYGIWTKMQAIYPMVGGTATTHKFNLKNPADTNAAFRLSFNGGWSHSVNGALPNGTNAYADTFFIPNTNFSSTDIHLSYYSGTNSIGGITIDMGVIQSPPTIIVDLTASYSSLGSFTQLSGTAFISAANADGRGYYIGSRIGSALRLFKNGSQIASNLSSIAGGLPTINIRIGQRNPDHYTNRQCRFATIGVGLTVTEVANLYTAIQSFQTTLGRQV